MPRPGRSTVPPPEGWAGWGPCARVPCLFSSGIEGPLSSCLLRTARAPSPSSRLQLPALPVEVGLTEEEERPGCYASSEPLSVPCVAGTVCLQRGTGEREGVSCLLALCPGWGGAPGPSLPGARARCAPLCLLLCGLAGQHPSVPFWIASM